MSVQSTLFRRNRHWNESTRLWARLLSGLDSYRQLDFTPVKNYPLINAIEVEPES
jgi:hypothetical protein